MTRHSTDDASSGAFLPRSLVTIGREFGLSCERGRQIESRARAKLRALAKEKALNH